MRVLVVIALFVVSVAAQRTGLLAQCSCPGRARGSFLAHRGDVVLGVVQSRNGATASVKIRTVLSGCLERRSTIQVTSRSNCGVNWARGRFWLLFLERERNNYFVGRDCVANRLWNRLQVSTRNYLKANRRSCNVSPPPPPPRVTPPPPPPPPPPRFSRFPGVDLGVDRARLGWHLTIEDQRFAADSCAVLEGCVDAPGLRKLLRFTAAITNIGTRDFVAGIPSDPFNPLASQFEYHACHQHYHFKDFTTYEFTSEATGGRILGHKQSFCLTDSAAVSGRTFAQRYNCENMGISAGMMDIYGSNIECQWIDITDVRTPGRHILRVVVDPDNFLQETNRNNNVEEICVFVNPFTNQATVC